MGGDGGRGKEEVALLTAVCLRWGGEVDVDGGVDCDGHFGIISLVHLLVVFCGLFPWSCVCSEGK